MEISSTQTETDVTICIADNGKGIAADFHGKIFDLFEQLNASDEGTGIGLAIVKRVIEHHGGKIWVESVASHQGSRFYIQLPLVDRNNTNKSTM
ncbi:MAG: sensor histidine kinase [Pirellulales bacterium]